MDNALRLGEIIDFIEDLRKEGKSEDEIRNMVCYLGNDDELNGLHLGYTISEAKETDDDWYFTLEETTPEARKDGVIIIS